MEAENSKFNEFKFDSDPYISTLNGFAKKVKENEVDNIDHSKDAFQRLDSLYTEKMKECSEISADIKRICAEMVVTHSELEMLKTEDEQISNLNLKDAINDICKAAFVQNNEEFRLLTKKIQKCLGFKLRLSPCHESHLWTAKFLFDISESENNLFVEVLYNTQDESFTLIDMRPKPSRYLDMVEMLSATNDITGLLYNCWKFFSSIPSND